MTASARALIGALALAIPMLAAPSPAQVRHAALEPRDTTPVVMTPAARPAPAEVLALGGIAGGAIGLLGGGYLGYNLERAGGCGGEYWFCGWGGMILGGIAGEALLLPLGVHLANGGRGRYLPVALASAGVGVAGLLAVAAVENASDGAGQAVLFTVPVLQIITAITVERSTHRARHR